MFLFPLLGEIAGRDEFKSFGRDIIVNTCYTHDTGMYETGIKVDDDEWIIVEYYSHKMPAKEGHQKWCEICGQEHFTLESVQNNDVMEY